MRDCSETEKGWRRLRALTAEALALADALGAGDVAIRLDAARLALERPFGDDPAEALRLGRAALARLEADG